MQIPLGHNSQAIGRFSADHQSKQSPCACRTCAGVTAALRAAGIVQGWRGELYPVLGTFGQPPLCLVERAAAAHFGIKVRSNLCIVVSVVRSTRLLPTVSWQG